MQIAVEATKLVRDRRGIGRYTRRVLRCLVRLDSSIRVTLLVHSSDLDSARDELEALGISSDCGGVESIDRLSRTRFDLFWSPWTMTRHLPASGPIVVTIHDLIPLVFADPGWRRVLRRRRVARTFRRMISAADLILTVSHFTRSELGSRLLVPAERVRVVPPGVDGFEPGDVGEAAARVRELGIEGPYLLHVGAGEERKNIERLIRALAVLRAGHHVDHRLVLAGPAGDLHPDVYSEAVRKAGVQGAVQFACGFDDDTLQALYRAAAALVFPSLYEGFGLPILEAMASGTPVVASRTASIPEVADDAALYFDPQDIEDMARQCGRILTEQNLRRSLVAKGLVRAARFSWEDTARMTLEAFRELVTRRSSPTQQFV